MKEEKNINDRKAKRIIHIYLREKEEVNVKTTVEIMTYKK